MLRVSVLALVTGCAVERLSAPVDPARAIPVDSRPVATHLCIDECGQPAIRRYLLIIDGMRLRMPEDSLAINDLTARIPESEIAEIELFKGTSTTKKYATDGRPAIVVTTKRRAPLRPQDAAAKRGA